MRSSDINSHLNSPRTNSTAPSVTSVTSRGGSSKPPPPRGHRSEPNGVAAAAASRCGLTTRATHALSTRSTCRRTPLEARPARKKVLSCSRLFSALRAPPIGSPEVHGLAAKWAHGLGPPLAGVCPQPLEAFIAQPVHACVEGVWACAAWVLWPLGCGRVCGL